MSRNRGIAMVVVMFGLGLLAVTTLAISYLSNRSLMQSKILGETDEAFFAARAALSLKWAELKAGDEDPKQGRMTDSEAHYDVKVYLPHTSVPELPELSTLASEHYYILAKGFSRDPALPGPKPREVVLGALFKKSASVFTAAALAGDTLTIGEGSYTDTYDSATGLPGRHELAHVGVFNPGGSVNILTGGMVGKDGDIARADVLLPAGFTGEVNAAAGSYVAQTVNPFLTAPDPFPERTAGTGELSPGTHAPTLQGGEWVLKASKLELDPGEIFTLDVSAVPDGQTVYVDLDDFKMEEGRFEVYDNDVAGYGSGTASEVFVQVYATTSFKVETGGTFGTLNNEPRRMLVYCAGAEMKLELDSTAYMVARGKNQVLVKENSTIFGSLLGEVEVLLKDSVVHYDQNLAHQGTGAAGGGTLQFMSYQRLQ